LALSNAPQPSQKPRKHLREAEVDVVGEVVSSTVYAWFITADFDVLFEVGKV